MLFKVHVLSVFIVQIACILSVLLIFGLQSTDIRVLDSVLFLCYLMLMFFFALLMLRFSRHSLHWSIESQARTWRRPKRYPGFHILHNIDIVSCTCCMYIPVYFVLCTIYICMLSENKEDLPLHFTHLHTSQSNHFYQHLHFWLQFATNLSMRGVFKFASRNHSQVVKMTKSTFSRNLFWFVKVQNGKFLVSRTCIHPDWTNHRWVSPDMFSFRDKDFKCLLSPGWECGSFEVWRVSTHLVLGKLVDSMTSQNEVTKKSSNWDSISWIPWKETEKLLD